MAATPRCPVAMLALTTVATPSPIRIVRSSVQSESGSAAVDQYPPPVRPPAKKLLRPSLSISSHVDNVPSMYMGTTTTVGPSSGSCFFPPDGA
jgi:hypothetical protein